MVQSTKPALTSAWIGGQAASPVGPLRAGVSVLPPAEFEPREP